MSAAEPTADGGFLSQPRNSSGGGSPIGSDRSRSASFAAASGAQDGAAGMADSTASLGSNGSFDREALSAQGFTDEEIAQVGI